MTNSSATIPTTKAPTDTAGERIGRHTPGPWQFKYAEVGFSIDAIQIIGNVDTNWHGDGLCYTNVCEVLESSEERANARLITAAPDLYEAIKALIVATPAAALVGAEALGALKLAAAALDKAEGR